MSDLVEWLRPTIEDDKSAAQKVLFGMPGIWVVGEDPHGEYVEVIAALREDAQPGDGYWSSVCTWDVASIAMDTRAEPEDIARDLAAVARHLALHDPRDTIARCDAELAILDEHHAINGESSCAVCIVPAWGYPSHGGSSPARYPCSTVLGLASGYRHRPGYPGAPEETTT